MHEFQRARQPEQKGLRRNAILHAAEELIAEGGLHDLSLSSIAERAGLSKANTYRYFESREEILLDILMEDQRDLIAEIEQKLSHLKGSRDEKRVAQVIAQAFIVRPRLCQLLGMVSSILEHNLSEDAIINCKRELVMLSQHATRALHTALPNIALTDCGWMLGTIALYVAGLWPAAHPAPPAARVLARDEFAALRPVFERDLTKGILVLLRGVVMSSTSKSISKSASKRKE
jgi:TetR/AcrR family transcriptional regulator